MEPEGSLPQSQTSAIIINNYNNIFYFFTFFQQWAGASSLSGVHDHTQTHDTQ